MFWLIDVFDGTCYGSGATEAEAIDEAIADARLTEAVILRELARARETNGACGLAFMID